MRVIKYIVVHCSAGNQKQTADDVVKYHTGKGKNDLGWSAPGYHYFVDAGGKVTNIWPVERIANGVKGHNGDSIHVCWAGGIDLDSPGRPAVDNRTDEQKRALIDLLRELKGQFREAKILGHRDFSPDKNGNGIVDAWERIKECPCFDAIVEYGSL